MKQSRSKGSSPVLDVPAPHEPVHGGRDFLLHIAAITIGLLIAIGFEASAQWVHHHHLVTVARENVHREVVANQQLLPQNLAHLREDAARMQANIVVIRQLRDHPRAPHGKLSYTLGWSPFANSAWGAARDTGALAYMPYDELQSLSQIYVQQEYISSLGTTLVADQGKAPSILASENSVDDLQLEQLAQLMGRTTDLLTQLDALQQRLAELQRGYESAGNSRNTSALSPP